uniref:Uncharacterized protein n=1 Tax=Leersia perrieri TaxID=77586 RepID=A0A0D9VUE4_9ORYZ
MHDTQTIVKTEQEANEVIKLSTQWGALTPVDVHPDVSLQVANKINDAFTFANLGNLLANADNLKLKLDEIKKIEQLMAYSHLPSEDADVLKVLRKNN